MEKEHSTRLRASLMMNEIGATTFSIYASVVAKITKACLSSWQPKLACLQDDPSLLVSKTIQACSLSWQPWLAGRYNNHNQACSLHDNSSLFVVVTTRTCSLSWQPRLASRHDNQKLLIVVITKACLSSQQSKRISSRHNNQDFAKITHACSFPWKQRLPVVMTTQACSFLWQPMLIFRHEEAHFSWGKTSLTRILTTDALSAYGQAEKYLFMCCF